ncbi:MAG: methylaspartate mutase [Betaproteobacteria bacterium RIFCSPLOWO2_12_FULL_62_58]|nr:MAG: methylaspartate mutase [Betaproteobacteria bacterium RIFCSPLOWO2_12_FULL_62_58]
MATVVTGTVGTDVHSMGLRVLEYALRQSRYSVVSLGVQAPLVEFVDAAREAKAAAIWVSSLAGHAEYECADLRDMCTEAGLVNIPLYIGGILAVGPVPWEEIEAKFQKLGFTRVYPPGTLPAVAISDLEKDLAPAR